MEMQIEGLSNYFFLWTFESKTTEPTSFSKTQGTFKLNSSTIRTFDTYFEQFFKH